MSGARHGPGNTSEAPPQKDKPALRPSLLTVLMRGFCCRCPRFGLEIKREVLEGEWSSLHTAALPSVVALGGMLVPAAIYLAFNGGDPTAGKGWRFPPLPISPLRWAS